jgi:hypothetical protein
LSGVPIDPTEAIYQGDALEWDGSAKQATKAGPSATAFIGISETTNPIETAGSASLLSDLSNSMVTVMQDALVERIAEASETLYPFDKMTVGSDAQKACKAWATNANVCYVVDPKWATASGKAVVAGDVIRVWLKPRPAYTSGPASAPQA